MGREVKRVPLDFDWPVGKIWYGYLISTCMEDACDECRQFAKLKGLEMKSYNCPVFAELEPPVGDGWQMWENVTEGSPISPVFKTPKELARWLADNKASAFGSSTATYDQWMGMIKAGYAPSAVVSGGKFMSGVEAANSL